jgi:hypothetical protein
MKILGLSTALCLGLGCGSSDELPPGVAILQSQLSAPSFENDAWVRTGFVGTQVNLQPPEFSDTHLSEPAARGMSGDARLLVKDRRTGAVTTYAISDAKATVSIAGVGGAVQLGMPADGSFLVNGQTLWRQQDAAQELFKHPAFKRLSVGDLTTAYQTMALVDQAPAPTSKKAVGRAIKSTLRWLIGKGITVKVGGTF